MVIQRWQSLLLLVSAVMMGLFTFCSIGQITTTDFTFNFTSMGLTYEGEATGGAPSGCFLSTWYFFTVSLMSAILLLIDIFLYGNLPLQKKVAWIAVMFIVASCAIAASIAYTAVDGGVIGWSSIVICPIIAFIGTLLALNRIQSDHNKLRSVDRIR
ncbi:MAG: DUF4293 domain-containing protein [Bacteroides sp.]|nr:DUF4293 domain-containing protein [Bacteroides sp.]